MTTKLPAEEVRRIDEDAYDYSRLYDVRDLDLRGELERTGLGWKIEESLFDKFVEKVIELVKIATLHAYEEAASTEALRAREREEALKRETIIHFCKWGLGYTEEGAEYAYEQYDKKQTEGEGE